MGRRKKETRETKGETNIKGAEITRKTSNTKSTTKKTPRRKGRNEVMPRGKEIEGRSGQPKRGVRGEQGRPGNKRGKFYPDPIQRQRKIRKKLGGIDNESLRGFRKKRNKRHF